MKNETPKRHEGHPSIEGNKLTTDRAEESRNCSDTEVTTARRIVVCDYSGHPFQVQLSRELARRGHRVLHLYSRDFLTPHGLLNRQGGDAPSFEIQGLSIGEPHAKDSFVTRRKQEKRFGSLAAKRALASKPDVVLSCNMPLDAQAEMSSACRRRSVGFVFWLQDIYSVAISRILTRRFGLAGWLVGLYYRSLERSILKTSDSVICISDDFVDVVTGWGVPADRCAVIPNWGPVDEICVGAKANVWGQAHNLQSKTVVLYSGTLGLKHNIAMIIEAAGLMRNRVDVVFVVVSEGLQADRLRASAMERGLGNVMILPFQPYEQYSQVLATADILIAFIDGDAGVYSVPSKILSYLCSGRPVVLAAPELNLASQTVVEAQAGIVVPANAPSALARSIGDLVDDDARRVELGLNARKYAETHFSIGRVADRFEAVLTPVATSPRRGRAALWTMDRWSGRPAADEGGWSAGAERAQ